MSEEEIIEIIEKLQCEYKEQQNDKKYNDYTVFKAKEYSKGLQGLLDLYNKEKEKNKELFEEYNKRVATIIKYEQEIKEIIDKIDVEDYYCLNEAEEDLRKLVEGE